MYIASHSTASRCQQTTFTVSTKLILPTFFCFVRFASTRKCLENDIERGGGGYDGVVAVFSVPIRARFIVAECTVYTNRTVWCEEKNQAEGVNECRVHVWGCGCRAWYDLPTIVTLIKSILRAIKTLSQN